MRLIWLAVGLAACGSPSLQPDAQAAEPDATDDRMRRCKGYALGAIELLFE